MQQHPRECHSAQEVRETYREARRRLHAAEAKAEAAHAPTLVVRTVDEPAPVFERRRATSDAPLRVEDIPEIMRVVAAACRVSWQDMASHFRETRLVRARYLAIYLAYRLTPATKADLARAFRRDHGTIAYALVRMRTRVKYNKHVSTTAAKTGALVLAQIAPHDAVACARAVIPTTAREDGKS